MNCWTIPNFQAGSSGRVSHKVSPLVSYGVTDSEPQIKQYNRISSHTVKTLQQACSTRYKDETPPTYHIWHPPPPNNTDSRRQCTMKTAADWGRLPSNHLSRRRPKKKLPVNKCCLSGSNPTSHWRDMRTIHFPIAYGHIEREAPETVFICASLKSTTQLACLGWYFGSAAVLLLRHMNKSSTKHQHPTHQLPATEPKSQTSVTSSTH